MTNSNRDLKIQYYQDLFTKNYLMGENEITWLYINKSITKFINEINLESETNSDIMLSGIIRAIKSLKKFTMSEIMRSKQFTKNVIKVKIINDAIEETVESMIQEAVDHFRSNRVRIKEDDGRYLKKEELDQFLEKYKNATGDLELKRIHIGKVYKENSNKLDCYEVTHKLVWDNYRQYCYANE